MKYKMKDNNIIINRNKKYNIVAIRDRIEDEKPREKMIKMSPETLSSAELLAVILNSGTKKEEVLSMADRILKEYGKNSIINEKNPKNIEKQFGLPLVKSCQIVACFELGRRFFNENKIGTITIRNAKQAFEHLKDMGNLNKEHFKGLYLNSRYKLVHSETISIGTLDASIIHPREVFKPALEYSASAVIIAHNHPSGVLKPSKEDLEINTKLKEAGEILGIEILDHLIISKNKFISLS
ncbi:MAG TPA: DNA repair protein RadC [bacterium]|nr:DNA repair protein RadC [bacterium]HPV65449.1 DNA repair protein RadC [bacterium]